MRSSIRYGPLNLIFQDKSGTIDANEIKAIFDQNGGHESAQLWQQLINEVGIDKDSDGQIDIDEFCAFMEKLDTSQSQQA